MESGADKLRALLLAVGVHLLCVALMFVGLLWTRITRPVSVAGGVIEATLVSGPSAPSRSQAAPAARREVRETAPAPQPRPAPRPQEAVTPPQPQPQAPLPVPDQVEQERAARLAQQQAEERARQEQEERRRQAQVELDERQREEVEQRERLNRMQEEQAAQLADIRRRREEAEARRKREEARLEQLADRRAETERSVQRPVSTAPPSDRLGNQGSDDSLLGRYQLAIQQAVQQNWLRPDSARPGIHCRLRIVQIPGGEVIQVSVTSPCNADDLTRRSIEAAVLKANPLPYTGYESVFQREVLFNFRYDG